MLEIRVVVGHAEHPAGRGANRCRPVPPSAARCRRQSPAAYSLSTNGASCTTATLRFDKTSHHSRTDVTMSTVTTDMNNSATNVFRRSLNTSRWAPGRVDPVSDAAWARKPSFGSAEKTFCQPAVMVTVTSQASGVSVTQANRCRPILMRIVVPTHSATAASSWFEIPNSGHSELIPPSGSTTPWYRKYPHPATITALDVITLGYHDVSANRGHTWPTISCSMNRPTRVPVSMVVRMNKASNMIAKWYHRASSVLPPSTLVAPAKIWAIPTASDGAPPERASSVVSPMRAASSRMKSGVTTNPAWPSTCDACASAAGVVFIAKYTPGSRVQAAIIAITPTNDSISMPPYPMSRASDSRAIILGVVPEATSAWNPEIAPHAIVMNANGNSFPAKTGPSPSVAKGVSAGMRSGGRITRIAIASTRIVVIFRNVER